MWNQKIGISVHNHYPISTAEVVKQLAQIGFDAISPEWADGVDLAPVVAAARESGLEVQSLHAPFTGSAAMWSRDEAESAPAKAALFRAVDDCHALGIPVLVMHTWIGFEYTFDATAEGFRNYDEVVARAAACGVKIAFENTEGEEYLFALMEHYKDNPAVGYCWDSGHEMCYNHSQDLLARFGDRLMMTHLNDNLGISRLDGGTFWTDDLHLLPYDGVADWDDAVCRLKKARKQEILNFELNKISKPNRHENDGYDRMDLVLYYTEAYKRACKIAYRYAR